MRERTDYLPVPAGLTRAVTNALTTSGATCSDAACRSAQFDISARTGALVDNSPSAQRCRPDLSIDLAVPVTDAVLEIDTPVDIVSALAAWSNDSVLDTVLLDSFLAQDRWEHIARQVNICTRDLAKQAMFRLACGFVDDPCEEDFRLAQTFSTAANAVAQAVAVNGSAALRATLYRTANLYHQLLFSKVAALTSVNVVSLARETMQVEIPADVNVINAVRQVSSVVQEHAQAAETLGLGIYDTRLFWTKRDSVTVFRRSSASFWAWK